MGSDIWSQGYFARDSYTVNYYRDQSPALLAFNMLLEGLEYPQIDDAATHCELGFGQGLTLAINAACTGGRWFGNDFMPEHVQHAQNLLSSFRNDAEVTDQSFEELVGASSKMQFDTVSLHGIWSWINDTNRSFILRFLRERVKPGGLVYLSYNAQPGWSSGVPVQFLMNYLRTRVVPSASSASKQTHDVLSLIHQIADLPSGYFEKNSAAREWVKGLARHDTTYLAHEYFNDQSRAFHFAEVFDQLAQAKLEFGTRSHTLEQLEADALPPAASAMLESTGSRRDREQLRDFFINRLFRRDIFVRGARRLSPLVKTERIMATELICLLPQADLDKALGEAGIRTTVDSCAAVVSVLEAGGPKPMRISEIATKTKMHTVDLLRTVVMLTGAAFVVPCQPVDRREKTRAACVALNMHLLEQMRCGYPQKYLASPVLGTGVGVSQMNQVFLLAEERAPNSPAEWIMEWLKQKGEQIRRGETVLSDEDAVNSLKSEYAVFRSAIRPRLAALGLV